MLNSLNDKFKSQDAELAKLRARLEYLEDQKANGWADEKKEIQDDYFAKGFHFYLIGFMANDQDYSFEKFGESTVAEMAAYRREFATEIKERRVELGLEDPEDAPVETAPKIQIEPSNFEIGNQVPQEGAPPKNSSLQPSDVNQTDQPFLEPTNPNQDAP